MIRFVYLLLLLLLGSCDVFEPPEPWDEFIPPSYYSNWHAEVQTCVNEQRSFDDIIWRVVYTDTFRCGGQDAIGCFARPKTIYLTVPSLAQRFIVKAEIIHYIRQDGAHDALFKRCGGG